MRPDGRTASCTGAAWDEVVGSASGTEASFAPAGAGSAAAGDGNTGEADNESKTGATSNAGLDAVGGAMATEPVTPESPGSAACADSGVAVTGVSAGSSTASVDAWAWADARPSVSETVAVRPAPGTSWVVTIRRPGATTPVGVVSAAR